MRWKCDSTGSSAYLLCAYIQSILAQYHKSDIIQFLFTIQTDTMNNTINVKVRLTAIIFASHLYLIPKVLASPPQSLPPEQLLDYEKYPSIAKTIITKAYDLEQQNLTYLYGSDDPKKGGMDCSGAISYLLKSFLPYLTLRQADDIYKWVWREGKFYAVNGHSFNSFEFERLHPGDLLFWRGTYEIHRDPPITHVMLYLGKNSKHQPVMFGSSDGRSYEGKKIYGVSVFDFKLPDPKSSAQFVGYSCIPYLSCEQKTILPNKE